MFVSRSPRNKNVKCSKDRNSTTIYILVGTFNFSSRLETGLKFQTNKVTGKLSIKSLDHWIDLVQPWVNIEQYEQYTEYNIHI